MKINVFYQAEGVREIAHLEVEPDVSFGWIKDTLPKTLGLGKDAFLFLEDAEELVELEEIVGKVADNRDVKLHVHRCREVKVSVAFNGKTVRHQFTPATTVAKVKKWAAIREFAMTEEEAGEHVLQISGTDDRPAPNTHIGTLVKHPGSQIAFNLVPDERVNGAAAEAA